MAQTQQRKHIFYCSHQQQVKLFTVVFIRDFTLTKWPTQQRTGMGDRDKRKAGRKITLGRLTENITVQSDWLNHTDGCEDEWR